MKRFNRFQVFLNSWIVIITLILFSANIHGQTQNPEWITDTLISADINLAYHLYVPQDYDESINYPLVVHLHGDNLALETKYTQLPIFRGPVDFISTVNQSKNPCFVLVPISEKESFSWIELTGEAQWGGFPPITYFDTFHPLLELIDNLSFEYNINTNRIYLNGVSGGAMGSWAYLGENPDYFAAALILCGGAYMNTESQLNAITHIPVWNHHGEEDLTVAPSNSRRIFQNYEIQGLPVVYPDRQKYVKQKIPSSLKQNIIAHDIDYIYTEYEGLYHNVWDATYYDRMVYDWLFSKRKRTRGIISILADSSYTKLQPDHILRIASDVDSLQMVLHYTSDLGYSWDSLGQYPSNMDSIQLSTQQLNDSPQGQFRIQLIDNEGYIIGTDYSGYYVVDNQQNCIPWLKHYVSAHVIQDKKAANELEYVKFMFYANDVETDTMNLDIYLKPRRDMDYQFLRSEQIPASINDQPLFVNLDTLIISQKGYFKFVLSDGENVVSDSSDFYDSFKYEKTELIVWPNSINLAVNDSFYFFHDIYPVYETDRIESLSSGDEEIATIRESIVKAVSPGETYIYYSAEAYDGYFADSCLVTVYDPTTVFNLSGAREFRLYPNPAKDLIEFHTDLENQYRLEIVSLNGYLIFSKEMEGSSHQIDLSSFEKGVYFITIRSKNFVATRKIIKL